MQQNETFHLFQSSFIFAFSPCFTMLSQLLDVIAGGRDDTTLDRLLTDNKDLFLQLTPYFYEPKPSQPAPAQPDPNAQSTSLLPDGKELCKEVAQWTDMDLSHITQAFNQLRSTAIDSFSITTNQVMLHHIQSLMPIIRIHDLHHDHAMIQLFDFVFEERRRVYSTLIALLHRFSIKPAQNDPQNEHPFHAVISRHVNLWVKDTKWRDIVVAAYRKLTDDRFPSNLPHHLRAEYCLNLAKEQLFSHSLAV